MATEIEKILPHHALRYRWPKLFAIRRKFNRQAENQPYVEFLSTKKFVGEPDEDNASGEDCGTYSEDEDEVESNREITETTDESRANTNRTQSPTYVRLFMEGLTRDEDLLDYRDQVDWVATFSEHANHGLSEVTTSKVTKKVALLDQRVLGGAGGAEKGSWRPYYGPLTAPQLREKLSRPRFRVESEPRLTNAFEDEQNDAERRLIFVTDLDQSTLEALAMTTSRTDAPALKDLFYKYLTRKTSIGVTIPAQGFQKFTLDFHIPYFALREKSPNLLYDPREKSKGQPLRRSQDLPFLSTPISGWKGIGGGACLYEAQISFVLTGIDHWVWSAYCTVDTWFDSKEAVEKYHEMIGQTKPDPLLAGKQDVDQPLWGPREYFFRAFEIRVQQVLKEWNSIVVTMEEEVKQKIQMFPAHSSDDETRNAVREIGEWNREMVKLLRLLTRGLSDTVAAWKEFDQSDIGYFKYEGQPPPRALSFEPSVERVAKVFLKLNTVLEKLQSLENELCQDNPQGVHAHLIIENNEAALFQRRAARHVEVLTVITVVFFPLALAAALFSTTGVLPFSPNPIRFTYVLVILSLLIMLTLVVLFNWRLWLQPLFAVVDYVRAFPIYCKEVPVQEQIRSDVFSISRFSAWRSFSGIFRSAELSEGCDLEMSTLRRRQSELERC